VGTDSYAVNRARPLPAEQRRQGKHPGANKLREHRRATRGFDRPCAANPNIYCGNTGKPSPCRWLDSILISKFFCLNYLRHYSQLKHNLNTTSWGNSRHLLLSDHQML
jgi:hypothetical protein